MESCELSKVSDGKETALLQNVLFGMVLLGVHFPWNPLAKCGFGSCDNVNSAPTQIKWNESILKWSFEVHL